MLHIHGDADSSQSDDDDDEEDETDMKFKPVCLSIFLYVELIRNIFLESSMCFQN